MGDNQVIELRADTEGFHASLKDAHQAITEHRQATCPHAYEVLDFDGNPVSKPYTNIFCPDCGLRIEAPGPTKPFQLKPHQR